MSVVEMKPLILVGGGGHCKSVIDVAESAGYVIEGILGRPEEVGKTVLGYKVIGTDDDMVKFADSADFIVTVGQIKSPELRIKLHRMLDEFKCHLATIIAPTAYVSKYAIIGEGSVIMHHAFVNADSKLGKGCIINTASTIEHEAVVGNYCHISTGAKVNGAAIVRDESFVGSGSVINQCVTIGKRVVIGAGSVVITDLPDNCLALGVPAKPINITR
jgi:sugar O-acyltransferase (sialic acid O-acetyltransferase NeuD family)